MTHIHYRGTVQVSVSNVPVRDESVNIWIPSPPPAGATQIAVEQVTAAPMIPTIHPRVKVGFFKVTVGIDALFTGEVTVWKS